ncbi:hypothetical protein [Smaragdicoccus niigatensis]|uniref:hypothetical protein n=1 Tax=Smaragdicoccus niigatensis TaxID=359359 RepID=UPI0012DCE762|nr:hypothetical protein [Smaragdicoccus niigatensis]
MAILKSPTTRRMVAACLCGAGLTLMAPAVASTAPTCTTKGTLVWCTGTFGFSSSNSVSGTVGGFSYNFGYRGFNTTPPP